MVTITKFEDIEAWRLARQLTLEVYRCSGRGAFGKDFALRDQMRRASVSIMSNIAEGFERGGAAEFGNFMRIAKGSAGEVAAQLYVAYDQGYISKEEFNRLLQLTTSTKKLLAGFINYLKQTREKERELKKSSKAQISKSTLKKKPLSSPPQPPTINQ